ncbi:hypothetical protein HCJ66_09780 [Listeria sp. FSL L7-1582]|uniref:hypothetical protein n=1 Tax=Listeria portnoyi TaxID=2713504 RepID=UPI00164DD9C2|nr:hypothetical protein [Listeria portnoyi]MBC6309829.1 hypothetical protein [Listeria portnoyi]
MNIFIYSGNPRNEEALTHSYIQELIRQIKSKADLIILASPVFAQAVSTDMKIFVERISHFAHDNGKFTFENSKAQKG